MASLICSRDRTHTGGRNAMWSLTPHGESHVGSHVVTWMVPCVVTLWFTIRVKPRDDAPFSKAHTMSRNLQMLICPNYVYRLYLCALSDSTGFWSMAFTELWVKHSCALKLKTTFYSDPPPWHLVPVDKSDSKPPKQKSIINHLEIQVFENKFLCQWALQTVFVFPQIQFQRLQNPSPLVF